MSGQGGRAHPPIQQWHPKDFDPECPMCEQLLRAEKAEADLDKAKEALREIAKDYDVSRAWLAVDRQSIARATLEELGE